MPKGATVVAVVSGDGGAMLNKGFFIVTIRFAFINAALSTRTLSLDTAEFNVLYAEKSESAKTIAEITSLLHADLKQLSENGVQVDGKTMKLDLKIVADHKYARAYRVSCVNHLLLQSTQGSQPPVWSQVVQWP